MPSTIRHIQDLGVGQSSLQDPNTLSITAATGVAEGHSIVITTAMDVLADTVSVTDSANNTYQVDADVATLLGTANLRTVIISAHGVRALPAGATIQVTFPAGTTTGKVASAAEFAGLDALNPFDQRSTNVGQAESSPTSGFSPPTTQIHELVYGAVGVQGALPGTTFTPGAGYTELSAAGPVGPTNLTAYPEYLTASAVGQFQANGTLSSTLPTTIYSAAVTTYRADLAMRFGIEANPPSPTAGTPFTLTVIARDASNNPVPGYTGTVTVRSSDGVILPPTQVTFTRGSNGVIVLSVNPQRAGPVTFTVTDVGDGALGSTSSPVTIGPGPAAFLEVLGDAAGTAGQNLALTVTAWDAFGNVASGYRGTVHFSSSDPQATLPADYTFTPADNGTRTFSFTPRTAGPQIVSASHGSAPPPQAGQWAFTVRPAAASRLAVMIHPDGTTTVTALDPFGNVATGYTGTVHFVSSDLEAQMPSDYTFTTADKGSRTLNLLLRTPGSQTVTVTDTQNASLTSGTISTQVAQPPRRCLQPTQNQRFVCQVYHDLLYRAPEDVGLFAWSGMLDAGQSRSLVVQGVLASQEYREQVVRRVYLGYLGREPDPAGLQAWVAYLGSDGTVARLRAFVLASPEYFQRRGGGTNEGFLNAAYHDVFLRGPDPAGRSGFTALLAQGVSREQVTDIIFSSDEFRQHGIRDFYQRFIRRVAEPEGLAAWLRVLQGGATENQLITGFVSSPEYYARA